jgi:hypothetical protein
LFGRLFGKGATLSPRDAEEWRDQMTAALASEHFSVKQAAYRALLKYMDLGVEEERFGETLLNP